MLQNLFVDVPMLRKGCPTHMQYQHHGAMQKKSRVFVDAPTKFSPDAGKKSIKTCKGRHQSHWPGDAQPPATSTHSARQEPSLPSTSTMSVSHLQRQPTPFSLTGSGVAQYWSSSCRFFSSNVVFSKYGDLGSCRAGALAGQCCMVVCR